MIELELRYLFYSTLVILSAISGCISKLNVESTTPEQNLIVDGFITTDFGPHQVRLTRLEQFEGDRNVVVPPPVSGAVVIVTDLTDQSDYRLNENGQRPGFYETASSFQGVPNHTYVLRVFAGSDIFTSSPQTIQNGPEIDSVLVRFKKVLNADQVTFTSGLEVFTRWQDPSEENFYLWTGHKAAFQLITFPELYRDPQFGGPAPKPCCARCFIRENVSQINVLSDTRVNGEEVTALAAFIVDNGRRLTDRYFIEINQLHISREAFEFYNEVNTQLQVKGSIFDPPPSTIRGNIINTTNSERFAVGFFGAFDVSKQLVQLTPSMLEERQFSSMITDDCRTVMGATTQQPDFIN